MPNKPRPESTSAFDRGATLTADTPLTLPATERGGPVGKLAPLAALFLAAAPALGWAGDTTTTDSQPSDQQLTEITITAAAVHSIDQFTPTGSRLGLSIQELPASLDVISFDEMLGRGYTNVEQAADSQAGVTSGGSPGDLAQFSMRGFTGDEIMELRNGLYIGPEDMVGRPANTFNVATVQILKGPASVLYGEGAIGGVVNVVDKGPSFGPPSLETLLASGSFGSTSLGIGGTTHLGEKLAFRLDVSRTATDGYVRNSPAHTTEVTASATWRVTPKLALQLSLDYMQDRPSGYFGTPLVPISFATEPLKGVLSSPTFAIDGRMRYVNYNVGDAHIGSTQAWPHVLLTWHPTENVTFENYAYYLHAYREWFDAETYTFSLSEPGYLGVPRINRDRFYVIHHQSMIGDQGSLTYDHPLLGHANKVVLGYEYSHLKFYRTPGGPPGDNVDPFQPDRGVFNTLYPAPLATFGDTSSKWNDYAGFFEDVFDLTKAMRLVTGVHYDQLKLYYHDYGAGAGYDQTYITTSERVGLVYNVSPYVTPYLAYSVANDPPNGEVFDSQATVFPPSHAWQAEAGVKGGTPDGMVDFTAAVYKIKRNNILTETAFNVLTNIGSESSRGAEVSTDFKPTKNWTVSFNGAYTSARFGSYIDPNTGVDDTGNQPADVPKWTANLWTSYQNVGSVPLELGGGVRYIGRRYGDEANTLVLENYTLVNLYASYHLSPHALLTARVNNLFDKAYAQWVDIYYPSQVLLGAPRYFELSLVVKY